MIIMVELEKHQLLVAAAKLLLDGLNPSEPMRAFNDQNQSFLPFTVNPKAGAVAIGDGNHAVATMEKLNPDHSNKFMVQASIDAKTAKDVRGRLKDFIWYSDPPIAGLLTCGNSGYVGNTQDVQAKLQTEILWNRGLNGSRVAVAIVDNGISLKRLTQPLGTLRPSITVNDDRQSSWTPPTGTSGAFEHRVGHGTMCAYDALIAAPKATLLDVAMLLFRPLGDHGVPSTVIAALAAYSFLANLWQTWRAMGASAPYQALVVNNSWGIFHPFLDPLPQGDPNRYIDNPNHALRNYFVIPMINAGVDLVFASNNCGSECTSATCLSKSDGMIMGMNAYEEVLTVGGCDIHDDRVGYSSKGPSIIGMKTPQTGTNKPDITAYTHFLGSKTRRIWLPDGGVSGACAVASGCVAALRSGWPSPGTPTATIFQALKSKARKGNNSTTNGGIYNPDYGYGIIDPVGALDALPIA